ncbi:enoyl-CoA hydratase-related protein [Yinghuangia sp. ASG 101]|uniref:enoyl-CoA hydratase-related protein n=1 Tax=Yinghuangia sp. ASG 101 TaxID=2896848 RepID=UPI001E376001|nr:enoyl-CoA hydratase-related protein [Yinghuangia sp. ASG 101]UGQ12760.1 enoyl-CoA hydratase-related protein [Yinghuangia sp. ASG 101]
MSESATAPVLFSVDSGVARLTLNSAKRKNAITLDMAALIKEHCRAVRDDETIGALIVDANGGYFCSGADTRDLAAASKDPATPEAVATISAVYGAFRDIGRLPVPTVGLVEGGAVGAGMNLALAVDVLIATPDAVLDSGFLARGIHPGGGHLSLLQRTVGLGGSIALGALGIPLTGTEAVARGLAWATAEADRLLATGRELTRHAAADPVLARRIKQSALLEHGLTVAQWDSSIEIERGAQMWSMSRKGSAAWGARR